MNRFARLAVGAHALEPRCRPNETKRVAQCLTSESGYGGTADSAPTFPGY